ncbi:hypothetical protein N7495_004890 [Penicillium taxi]|uniref:uncharacterized protein n=1 Tax=Penicillium taxi TaxID=168475 RepID=UPI0025453F55|nr:uncharacterized protein N7495_004890 [Penicillium taxi]KAJ5900146.1 hypothetical protein N7495_004890 [Penicillium taxi]
MQRMDKDNSQFALHNVPEVTNEPTKIIKKAHRTTLSFQETPFHEHLHMIKLKAINLWGEKDTENLFHYVHSRRMLLSVKKFIHKSVTFPQLQLAVNHAILFRVLNGPKAWVGKGITTVDLNRAFNMPNTSPLPYQDVRRHNLIMNNDGFLGGIESGPHTDKSVNSSLIRDLIDDGNEGVQECAPSFLSTAQQGSSGVLAGIEKENLQNNTSGSTISQIESFTIEHPPNPSRPQEPACDPPITQAAIKALDAKSNVIWVPSPQLSSSADPDTDSDSDAPLKTKRKRCSCRIPTSLAQRIQRKDIQSPKQEAAEIVHLIRREQQITQKTICKSHAKRLCGLFGCHVRAINHQDLIQRLVFLYSYRGHIDQVYEKRPHWWPPTTKNKLAR